MKAVSGKTFARVLESHGWELRRVHGSHHIYVKADAAVRISLPIHGNRPLRIGLQRHLMTLAGIEEYEL